MNKPLTNQTYNQWILTTPNTVSIASLSHINTHGVKPTLIISSLKEAFRSMPASLQILQTNNLIYVAIKTSLKDGKASHARILLSGTVDDLTNDLHLRRGSGPIDGCGPKLLLIPVTLTAENKEVQDSCANPALPHSV